MNERIKELAEQAGLKFSKDWGECYTGNVQIERFAELVRDDERGKLAEHYLVILEQLKKEEREACAKLCESMGVHPALNVWNGGPEWYQRQKECAAAIRGRTE
jgi:hypothetical protein